MDNQCLEKFKTHKGCGVLFFVIAIFLLSLIVYFAIATQNKIKEGKYIGQQLELKNTITVSDSGEVYAKPDLALTTFSVVTEAKTIALAMTENTKKMNAIVDFIKGQGVKDKDLKTTAFNISPRYEWYKDVDISLYPNGKRVLVGYEITQSLEVKIRDMEKIGDIIQGGTDAGANQIGDLQFTIDKEDELKKQARAEAIDKAKAKAKELASQLGVELVRITNFSENFAVPYRYDSTMRAEAMGGGLGEKTPQIETGENKISVTISITYEIN